MESITQHYIIDLSSNNNYVQVAAVEGDGYDARYMEIELFQNGTAYEVDPDTTYVTIMGTNAGGSEVWNTGTVTDDGYLLFQLTYTMMSSPGRGTYQVALMSTEENTQLKSFPFYVIVTKAALTASDITEDNDFQVLSEMIAEVESIQETIEDYVDRAETAATNAETSETNAATSETNAATSEANAATSETNAATSEANAATSEANAATSEANAATSEANAAASETAAAASAEAAATSEENADNYADLSKSYAIGTDGEVRTGDATDNSKYYSEQSAASATEAETSATNAATSETNAATSETNAAASATDASDYATASESYAIGGTGSRDGEDYDNAKYYKEQCEQISQGLGGALLPMGTIYFEDLDGQTKSAGYMYNIIDEFVTTDDFREGAGVTIPAGANVYYTATDLWDVLAGTPVTGVKGEAEDSYRKGNVEITKANLGIEYAVNVVISDSEPTQAENDYWLEDYE